MKSIFSLIALLLTLLLGSATDAQAQERPTGRQQKHILLQATKAPAGRGVNPRILADIPTTDVAKPKSRGETCQMVIINHTSYHVKVYIDGKFNSTVGPWGKNQVLVDGLAPVIYCMTTGGTLEWNGGGECDMGIENVFDLKP